jgi:hypothetical protein
MKVTLLIACIIFSTASLIAQTKKDGTPDMRYKANRDVYTAPSSASTSTNFSMPKAEIRNNNNSTPTTTTSIRPAYSGETHTESHGGTYIGETNSHHKDGQYTNPNSIPVGSRVYGTHKTSSSKRF